MIIYEYPFNERVRAYLRLEYLLRRLDVLLQRDTDIDHHFAITTLFEVMDVASRSDLKTDLLKDLERQRQQFNAYRDNPMIAVDMLDKVIGQIDAAHSELRAQNGKPSQLLIENEWLMAIRNRTGIPGGTCTFDLPSYHAWLHADSNSRRADLQSWTACFAPLASALILLLRLFRDAGAPQRIATVRGQFQQNLPQGRIYQLLRLKIDPSSSLVPEISGNRLMISIRMLQKTDSGQLALTTQDGQYEMVLCA
ncbi:cell division protein ZapD [Comamonas koreensis]|uniref:cell division protein ZapD n=1 Tax=Comamonas koreensis TaxID=160825 RepID=UPI0015FBE77A|nr:cell division protein ZapD [Comamonas koreensis]